MHISTPPLLHHIYAKTVKGQDEIVRPKFGLNPRQRRILTFVNGEHTLLRLQGNFPLQEMEDIVSTLTEQHFIFLAGKEARKMAEPWQPSTATPVCAWNSGRECPPFRSPRSAAPVLTEDPGKVLKAKEFMFEVAATHLGILGREVIQKVEAAQCAASLSSLAGQWTMALCASKTASRYAPLYLEQLKCILFEEPYKEPIDARAPYISAVSSPRHTRPL